MTFFYYKFYLFFCPPKVAQSPGLQFEIQCHETDIYLSALMPVGCLTDNRWKVFLEFRPYLVESGLLELAVL